MRKAHPPNAARVLPILIIYKRNILYKTDPPPEPRSREFFGPSENAAAQTARRAASLFPPDNARTGNAPRGYSHNERDRRQPSPNAPPQPTAFRIRTISPLAADGKPRPQGSGQALQPFPTPANGDPRLSFSADAFVRLPRPSARFANRGHLSAFLALPPPPEHRIYSARASNKKPFKPHLPHTPCRYLCRASTIRRPCKCIADTAGRPPP